jgi:undecaprenyl-diphosphatase
MSIFHIVILAIVQGITEFLPISSSGHLILTHALLTPGTGSQNFFGATLTMDIAVHIGSLIAVLIYFRKDIFAMMKAGINILKTGTITGPESRMLVFIVAGSIPVMALGLVIHLTEPAWARSLQVIGWTMLGFGILLGVADKIGTKERTTDDMTWRDAAIIGFAQMLALIPGTSRSGITMTAARFLGFNRVEAARYSFLLSIVAISAAGMVGLLDFMKDPQSDMITGLIVGIIVSFLAAIGAIHFLMTWLGRASFSLFVWYRVALGLVLLALLYTGHLA